MTRRIKSGTNNDFERRTYKRRHWLTLCGPEPPGRAIPREALLLDFVKMNAAS
jgi:hypothetical protein